MKPSVILMPGIHPVCVLQGVHIGELALSKQFVIDLYEKFYSRSDEHRQLTHEAIATDLFSGAVSREHITRIINSHPGYVHRPFNSANSFAIVCVLLLRSELPVTPSRYYNRPKTLPRSQRQEILKLLYHYGVKCADGSCCGRAADPIPALPHLKVV